MPCRYKLSSLSMTIRLLLPVAPTYKLLLYVMYDDNFAATYIGFYLLGAANLAFSLKYV